MADWCRCQRCSRVVKRSFGSPLRRVVFVSMFAATLPFAWLLFVAGPGVVGVLPIVIAIGCAISAGFGDWAFPVPDCQHCGAYTEWAPRVEGREARRLEGVRARSTLAV